MEFCNYKGKKTISTISVVWKLCKDALIYWVLTSEELIKTGKLGSQHRNENTGIAGREVFEGQVFMTEDELRPFWVEEKAILASVLEKGKATQH